MNETSASGFAEARQIVRAHDPERYFATLFAPAAHRDALFAIYAFAVEASRIRHKVSQPLPGEVRIQWWRDALVQGAGEAQSHPLAAAVLATIAEAHLPLKPFIDLLDARVHDLYDDLLPSWNDLEGYCGETQSSLFRLATLVLHPDAVSTDACGHAGVAFGFLEIMRHLARDGSVGQVFLPNDALKPLNLGRSDLLERRDTPELRRVLAEMCERVALHLAAVQRLASTVAPSELPAFLPLATVRIDLARLGSRRYDPFKPDHLQNWRRILAMWRWSL